MPAKIIQFAPYLQQKQLIQKIEAFISTLGPDPNPTRAELDQLAPLFAEIPAEEADEVTYEPQD